MSDDLSKVEIALYVIASGIMALGATLVVSAFIRFGVRTRALERGSREG